MNATDVQRNGRPEAPSHRRRRRPIVVAGVALAVLVGAACNDEQRRSLGEEDARDTLAAHVEQAVESEGFELDGSLECTATIDAAGALAANCSGATSSGDDVAGSYAGTADVDAEDCHAQLAVTIAGRPVVDEADVDCFVAP